MDTKHLDWAEKAGTENLKERIANGDILAAQANQLLLLLLAGVGGALAIGGKVFEGGASTFQWGAAAVAAYLSCVAVVLTHKCIVTRDTQVLYNEPTNLAPRVEPAATLDEIREWELENLQKRIELTKTRNELVARWLDRCRYAAACTPLAFVAAAALAT
jgi:hypothetical protein